MPKLSKPKKEKIPAEKQPKTKVPKTRQKKGKPASPKKTSKTSPFIKNRKALIQMTAALILVIVGSAVAIISLTIQKKGPAKEKAPETPSYYFSKDEGISSVTEVVGERNFEKLTDPQADQSEAQESPKDIYEYHHVEDVSADITSYRTYLEDEKNFIDVTDKTQQTDRSSATDSQADGSEIYQFAGPSKDSGSYLSLTLESGENGYTVTACKEKEPWNTYFKGLWNQQKKKIEDFENTPKATNTIEQAENTVRSQGQEKLGLPEAADSYEYIAAPGLANIEGKNYYTVRTYKRQSDNTLIYIATYLYDYSTSNVAYQYDEITRKTTPLTSRG